MSDDYENPEMDEFLEDNTLRQQLIEHLNDATQAVLIYRSSDGSFNCGHFNVDANMILFVQRIGNNLSEDYFGLNSADDSDEDTPS